MVRSDKHLAVDPVILPTSNNDRMLPYEFLSEAFPTMTTPQPRGNRRAVGMTPRYLTCDFAAYLARDMGVAALKASDPLPRMDTFLEEAVRPPPLYFETEETTFQGVCCVCVTKRDAWDGALTRFVDC